LNQVFWREDQYQRSRLSSCWGTSPRDVGDACFNKQSRRAGDDLWSHVSLLEC